VQAALLVAQLLTAAISQSTVGQSPRNCAWPPAMAPPPDATAATASPAATASYASCPSERSGACELRCTTNTILASFATNVALAASSSVTLTGLVGALSPTSSAYWHHVPVLRYLYQPSQTIEAFSLSPKHSPIAPDSLSFSLSTRKLTFSSKTTNVSVCMNACV